MRKMLLLALALVMALSTCALAETAAPKYVFMFIGDGMGNPQVTATQYYLGADGKPGFRHSRARVAQLHAV